jgi:lipoprotein-anchoring transpeptidase ErfK/SrfK
MSDRSSAKRTGTEGYRVRQGLAFCADLPPCVEQRLAMAVLLVVLLVAPTTALAAPQGDNYIVQPGDTLANIAARQGASIGGLVEANGIRDANLIYPGQVLVIPEQSPSVITEAQREPSGRAWIDVDKSEQWLTAYEGDTPVFGAPVSTGGDGYYTPEGEFVIEYMLEWQTMWGADYYLPDVPYVMYFADHFAIHGAYWHSAFGYPVSHGCVNLPVSAAGWLYNWASIGTPVVIHY